MTTDNKIRYCTSREIDFTKWDRCIEEADNGLIYAHSFYLDIMATKWDAMVLNDYEAVMPLTWNRKYGFYYLFQPYFVHSLGVFGKKITALTVLDFLGAIPKKFKYWDINLNESNGLLPNENNNRLRIITRVNYHLNLQRHYKEVYAGFRKTCRWRVRKAILQQVQIVSGGRPSEVIAFFRKHYERKFPKISPGVYNKLVAASTICFEKDQAKIYLASLPDGEITAVQLVLLDKNFVYLLIGGSSEKGKRTASFYLIIDAVIKDYAGSGRILRFEGSDIPGIAVFNEQFNSIASSYPKIMYNNLPFPLNLLKK
ncbi:MAG: hypothetical protein ABIN89_22095 [Chitinophagaceae bacterium]